MLDMKGFVIAVMLFVGCYNFTIKYASAEGNDLPEKLFAGEVHYSRIPVEYWQHRIQMIKALGLNSLSVYIMWNYHEIEKGKFDYSTENRNLSHFLDLAEKYNMKVLFRPGPYVCAEWDLGGYPARLLAVDGLVLRANNKLYLDQVKIYFESLVPIINKHLFTSANPKGSIILLQIQNEYGFYGSDKSYIEALRKIWFDLKIECPQYYVDTAENLQKCHWTGANIGINNGIAQVQYDYARTFERDGYIFGGQIYTGWLTHWGEKWQSTSDEKNLAQFGFLMENNHSYSMYMVHGGSNFGLTAGANAFTGQKYDYRGHVTSYDYDAPINEQGSPTSKYQALKSLIKNYSTWQIPAQPNPIKMIQIPRFSLTATGSLLNNLKLPTVSGSAKYFTFESNQLKLYNQGFAVYETNINRRKNHFHAEVHDYALVFLNGVFVTKLDRSESKQHDFVVECTVSTCAMRIVVEAMGHINFDKQMLTDFKGLINITDDLKTPHKWNIYRVPIDSDILKWNNYNPSAQQAPTLLQAIINLKETGDVYFDASELTKGYIWVNGRNLGRYWSKGPQNRVFCPGVWLKHGNNTIHVLELHYDGISKSLTGRTTLQLSSSQEESLLIE